MFLGGCQVAFEAGNVLCLAAGGGRHGPLYAASRCACHHGRSESQRCWNSIDGLPRSGDLQLRTIETSMDDLSMLREAEFDLVIHPVSTCYLPSVAGVFAEVARVTRPAGLYISQHKQPTNLQASLETFTGQYVIEHAYYDHSPVRTRYRSQ